MHTPNAPLALQATRSGAAGAAALGHALRGWRLPLAGLSLVVAGAAAGHWSAQPADPSSRPPAAQSGPRDALAPRAGAVAPAATVSTMPVAAQPSRCPDCGVVEQVRAVQRPGQASGVGAVAGGVLGGVLGHQIGGGNGRKLLTVIGAVGGGLAGHEIEKRQRATTEYRITLRMADGSRRSLTQATAAPVGTWMRVDGDQLRPLPGEATHGPAPDAHALRS